MYFPLTVSFWISRTRVYAGLGTQSSILQLTPASLWTTHFAAVWLRPCAGASLSVPGGEHLSQVCVQLTLCDTREELMKNSPKGGLLESTVAYWSIGVQQSGGYPPSIYGGALCSGELMRSIACNRDAIVSFSTWEKTEPIRIVPNTCVEFTGFNVLVDWRAYGAPRCQAEDQLRFPDRL